MGKKLRVAQGEIESLTTKLKEAYAVSADERRHHDTTKRELHTALSLDPSRLALQLERMTADWHAAEHRVGELEAKVKRLEASRKKAIPKEGVPAPPDIRMVSTEPPPEKPRTVLAVGSGIRKPKALGGGSYIRWSS